MTLFLTSITNQLPHGLIGLVLATLLAAAMSSLDSDLNTIAATIVQDISCRFWPQSTDRQQLFLGRAVVVIAGLIAIWMAQQWIGIESFLEYSVALSSIASGGMLGLFSLGLLYAERRPQEPTRAFCCVFFSRAGPP